MNNNAATALNATIAFKRIFCVFVSAYTIILCFAFEPAQYNYICILFLYNEMCVYVQYARTSKKRVSS